MAIAPSKLGRLIAHLGGDERAFVRGLRQRGLVRADVQDAVLAEALRAADAEHAAMPEAQRSSDTPHERVRVLLQPWLTDKGRAWSVPLQSLDLPDHDSPRRSRGTVTLAVVGLVAGGAVVTAGAPLGGSHLIASGAGLAVVALGHLVAPAWRPWSLLAVVWGGVAFAHAIRAGATLSFAWDEQLPLLARVAPAGRSAALIASAALVAGGLWTMLRRRAGAARSPAP